MFRSFQGGREDREKKGKKKDKKGSTNVPTRTEPAKKKIVQIELLNAEEDIVPVKNETTENNAVDDDPEEYEEKEEVTEVTTVTDVDMLQSLTGQPLPEDELLFAIPVIAPYNSIVNYK